MTVISHCEGNLAATGEKTSLTGGGKYTANYRLTTDNPADGPVAIWNYLSGLGINIGSTFAFGNDVDVLSFCKSIKPQRVPNSTTEWTCAVEYEPTEATVPGPGLPGGGPEDDPLDWRWEVSVSTQLYSRDAWGAYTIAGFPIETGGTKSSMFSRAAGEWGFVCNSAGTKLDPPPQEEVAEKVIRVRGWVSPFSMTYTNLVNTINDKDVQFSSFLSTNYAIAQTVFPKWTLKCTAADGTFRRANGVSFYDISYEFRYREIDGTIPTNGSRMTNTGWLKQLLDEGFDVTYGIGTPDSRGGVVSASDIVDGDDVPKKKSLTDSRTSAPEMLREPVPFDGRGSALPATFPNGIWTLWRLHEEAAFDLQTAINIFEAPGP